MRVGGWWDANGQDEVDIVAIGPDDALFVGECKWGPVSGRQLRKLRERARRVADELGSAGELHLALFSGRGETDDAIEAAAANGDVIVVGPDELV